MKRWDQRPFEIRNLFNPAFCGLVLSRALHGYEEEDARERRGAELHFADTPEKGDVGHADELLEQEAQHQRNGHAEDGAARIDAAAFDFEGHVQKD